MLPQVKNIKKGKIIRSMGNFILSGKKATNANVSDRGPDFLQLEEGEELDWGKRKMGGEHILFGKISILSPFWSRSEI